MIFQFVKSTSRLPSWVLWNNFTFQSIRSPSKSLHLLHWSPGSPSHRDTPHCTFAQTQALWLSLPELPECPWEQSSPCSLCLAGIFQRPQSAQTSSTQYCKSLCPGHNWLLWSLTRMLGKGKEAWSKETGILWAHFPFPGYILHRVGSKEQHWKAKEASEPPAHSLRTILRAGY